MTISLSELDDLFVQRHSCRAFRTDQVPRKVIEQIVATAQRAPSWCNAQPWHITVTSGAETDRFRTALQAEAAQGAEQSDIPFPETYAGIYLDRRRTCGWKLYEAVGVQKGDREGSARQAMQNFALFGAPHCALLTSPADLGPYGAVDCGGFVTAFTLAAQAAGLGTIAQAAVARSSPFLHEYFDIPETRLIVCAISFGYSDTDHAANAFRTERADLGEIIDWRG